VAAAETQAWLDRIPAAERLAAEAATHAALLSWIAGLAILVLGSAVVARTGVIRRVEAFLKTRTGRPGLARLAVGAGFLILLLEFGVLGDPQRAAAVAVGAALVMAVSRRRRWWMLSAPLAGAAVFALAWLPYGLPEASSPAPDGPVKAAVQRLVAEAGIPANEVALSPAKGFDGDVDGAVGPARIRLSQRALAAPIPEVRAYVAHLMGHYVRRDTHTAGLILAAAAVLATLAVAWGFAPAAKLLSPGAKADEPAGLPVTAAILALAVGATTPILNAAMRMANERADRYALKLTDDPDAYAAMLVRTWDGRAVEPGALEQALLYSHPPLARRIARAIAQKDKARETR
jgi:STE24 endopeptidase